MIGERLKNLRRAKGLSQKAFAETLSTSSGYISEIEQGKTIPGGNFFISLKRAFGVSIDWLLTGENEMDANCLKFSVGEQPTRYGIDSDPVIDELLEGARKVLESGNKVAFDALERNIRYFSLAIETEKRLQHLEARMAQLEEDRAGSATKGARIRDGSPPVDEEDVTKKRAM